jgi:hypothetical protein
VTERPRDTIGLIGSYYANNSDEMPNKPSQWVFELNYGISIAPNNFMAPRRSKEPSDAWIAGLQVTINPAQFFGFPVFGAY